MGHLYRFVEPVLLLILKEKKHSYGYDLSGELSRYSFTDSEIENAVLYRTLRRLEVHGYVTSHWAVDTPRPARRVYSLTNEGDKHLREWAQVLGKVASSMSRFARRAVSATRTPNADHL
jgi:DNA-binding PadR family transcriptional regulator